MLRKVAKELVETLPLVMRSLGSEMRHSVEIPSDAHFGILFRLLQSPANLSELARHHNVSLPTMSNSISILVEHGLVQRERAAHDRRQVVLSITDAGAEVLQKIRLQLENHAAQKLASLDPQQLEDLVSGLAVIRMAFSPFSDETIHPT